MFVRPLNAECFGRGFINSLNTFFLLIFEPIILSLYSASLPQCARSKEIDYTQGYDLCKAVIISVIQAVCGLGFSTSSGSFAKTSGPFS